MAGLSRQSSAERLKRRSRSLFGGSNAEVAETPSAAASPSVIPRAKWKTVVSRVQTLRSFERHRLDKVVFGTKSWERDDDVEQPQWYMCHPASRAIQLWRTWVALLSLAVTVIVPFRIAFLLENIPAGIKIFDVITAFSYIFDMGLQFITGFIIQGAVILRPRVVAAHYLKNGFFLDLVSTLPLDLVFGFLGEDRSASYLQLFRVLRIKAALALFAQWEKSIRNVNSNVIRLGRLLVYIILFGHWVACGWFYIAYLERFPEDGWTGSRNEAIPAFCNDQGVCRLLDDDIGRFYARALYWSLGTMLTVGYGDIQASTTVETVFAIGVMLTGHFIYALIIGNMATLVSQLEIASSAYRQKLDIVNQYMRYREVPTALQQRVRNYYDYLWTRHRGMDERHILDDLPTYLRLEVALLTNREILSKVPIFRDCGANVLNRIVLALRPFVISPGEIIFRRGEPGTRVYFINRGRFLLCRTSILLCHCLRCLT